MSDLDPRVVLLSLGVVAACAALVWCWMRLRGRPPTHVSILLGLRVLLLSLLLAVVADPAIRRQVAVSRPPLLLVAVDASRSMTELPPDGASRYERALRALEGELAAALESARAERYLLGGDAQAAAELPEEPRGRDETDLQAALSAMLRTPRARRPAACLLISDGADATWRPPARVAAALGAYGVPVFCIGVGRSQPVPDVSLPGLVAPRVVTEGDRFEVRVLARAAGLAGEPVLVRLRSGEAVVAEKELAAGEVERPARFELTAGRPGYQRYVVEAASAASEVTAANNRRSVVVRVEPRQARLLVIEGHPRREYAFLRRLLTRVEDLEPVILLRKQRPAEFWLDAERPRRAGGLSAAGELNRFRAVVVSNIEAAALGGGFVSRLEDYVAEGGALAMLGGEDSFGAGGWDGTALAPAVPVRMEGSMLGDPVAVRLAGEGEMARALRQTGIERWERLPLLDGMNAAAGARPGAEVALEGLSAGTVLGPVLVTGRHGAGRTLALTVADTWRWRQSPGAGDHSRAAWEALWTSIIGWLMAPRADRQVLLELGRDSFESGDLIRAEAHVRDRDFRPITDARVELTVSGPAREQTLLAEPADVEGIYGATFRAADPGDYALAAEAYRGEEMLGEDRRRFEVIAPIGELTHAARPEVLEAIAGETGGRYLPMDRAGEMADLLPLQPTTERRSVTLRPTRTWWYFVLVIAVGGLDWLLRRRWGIG